MALWDHQPGEELKFTINQNEFHYIVETIEKADLKTPMKKSAHRGAPRALAGRNCRRGFAPCRDAGPAAENIDLVVMVDTSESMFPYFDDLMNYLVQDLLASRLHRGDTFHLLSFSSIPEVEISLEMNSEEAARPAFGTHPPSPSPWGATRTWSRALQFLYKYTKELPETNPKQIILITDGVHDPPPGSPNRLSDAATRQAVNDVAGAMKKEGWTFNILKVPPEPAPGEEGLKSYLPDLAQKLGVPVVPYHKTEKENVTGMTTGFPSLIFPPALGKVGNRFIAPFQVKNWKAEPIIVRLSSVQSDGTELLDGKVSITVPRTRKPRWMCPSVCPSPILPGDHAANVQLLFQNDLRISPTSGTLSFTYTGKGVGGLPLPRLTYLYIVYIILALALLYALIRLFLFLRKKMQEMPAPGFAKPRVLAGGGRAGIASRRGRASAGGGWRRGRAPRGRQAGAAPVHGHPGRARCRHRS